MYNQGYQGQSGMMGQPGMGYQGQQGMMGQQGMGYQGQTGMMGQPGMIMGQQPMMTQQPMMMQQPMMPQQPMMMSQPGMMMPQQGIGYQGQSGMTMPSYLTQNPGMAMGMLSQPGIGFQSQSMGQPVGTVLPLMNNMKGFSSQPCPYCMGTRMVNSNGIMIKCSCAGAY